MSCKTSLDICEAALDGHPEARALTGQPLKAVPLPGLTNRVFHLEAEAGLFVLRLPREDTAGLIDRGIELHNLEAAAEAGLAVAPLYADIATGVLLLPSVRNQGLVTPEALGRCVGRLHTRVCSFASKRDVGAYVAECAAALAHRPDLSDVTAALVPKVLGLLGSLPRGPCVPNHFDLGPGNILVQSPENVLLIDFEYAAMADACWDLAYAVLENGFTAQEEARLLEAYRAEGGQVPDHRTRQVYKMACDTVSALWALAQVAHGRHDEQLSEFALERAARASAHGLEI